MVSEINTYPYSSDFPAAATLTDGLEDAHGHPANYWAGAIHKEASFVIDLGCESFVKEIHIRNSGFG